MTRNMTRTRIKTQKYKFIRASKNHTRSNKRNLDPMKCTIMDQREKQNFTAISNWNQLMKSAPTLFKKPQEDPQFKNISIKSQLDNQCGNIYIGFQFKTNHGTSGAATHSQLESAHLSFHYLKSVQNNSCKCWTKNRFTQRRTGKGSNIHYKIDTNKEHPIYIPIYSNSHNKFTYPKTNLKYVPFQHRMILDWIIQQLNNTTLTQ